MIRRKPRSSTWPASRTRSRRRARPTSAISITPTAQTRQIAGQPCTVHDLKVAVPMQMGGTQMTMVMSGPQCLVKNGPGQADFAAFYRAASENGGFLDAAQAKTRPATAKAMTDMYQADGRARRAVRDRDEDRHRRGSRRTDGRDDEEDGQHDHDGSHVGLDRGDRRDACSTFRRATRSASGSGAATAPRVGFVRLPPVRDVDGRTRRRLTGMCR